MCGFYGEYSGSAGVDASRVHRATDRIRHRGPDDEGYVLARLATCELVRAHGDDSTVRVGRHATTLDDETFDVGLGFRRLAIVDLSTAGSQPMTTADGRYSIVFNGEIYNHVELRAQLEDLGHRFVGHSDTEVLLGAYRQWGRQCVERLNGMWAFAILDLRHPESPLFLSRDRFGEKPLYVARVGDTFRFASEPKALMGPEGVPFRPDRGAVVEFLRTARMPSAQAGRTFFTNIESIPPAHCAVIGKAGLRSWRYWDLPAADGREVPFEAARDELRELLTDAVRIRMRADVPVGTCLSGGVDSSSIAATMGKLRADAGTTLAAPQHTFTAAYAQAGRHDERAFVDIVLDVLDASPVFTYPTAEGLAEELEAVVHQQDEPFGSTSIYAQWCVMRAVQSTGVKVLLDGQGADELFGGYRPFAYHYADLLRAGHVGRAARELRATASKLDLRRSDLLLRAGAHFAGLERFAGAPLARLAGRTSGLVRRGLHAPVARPWHESGGTSPLDSHLRRLTLETSLPELLRYEDRNSMAHGIEARTPFLDVRIAEFAFGAGASHRVRDHWTKHIVRSAMADRVPAEVIWRTDKIGFETPESHWRSTVRSLLLDRLKTSTASEIIDPGYCASADIDDRELWRALNVAVWWDMAGAAA